MTKTLACPPPEFCERLSDVLPLFSGSKRVVQLEPNPMAGAPFPEGRFVGGEPAKLSGKPAKDVRHQHSEPDGAGPSPERFSGRDDLRVVLSARRETLNWSLPEKADQADTDSSSASDSVAPTDFIARLPGGRVFGPGAVISPDGCSVARDVSTDLGKPFNEHWLTSYLKMKPPEHISGHTAVVAVTLGMGYCHWLLDELPRWLLLTRQGVEFDNVIAHTEEPFIREALAFGKFLEGRRVLDAKRYSHFECEELIVPSLVGRETHVSPAVVRMLTEFATPLLAGANAAGNRDANGELIDAGLITPASEPAHPWMDAERIYVTRDHAVRRRVLNEAILWEALESRGFTKVRLEDMRWADQVRLFSRAKVVVAPHGAGLANLVFANAGTRVIELFHEAYVNPCFARLAALKALDYHPLITASVSALVTIPRASSEMPASYDFKANRNDIMADVGAVVSALG